MFSMTIDLIPVRDRGAAAAMVTAVSYFGAAMLSDQWSFEFFQPRLLWVLSFGAAGMGILAFSRFGWTRQLAEQHRLPEYALGRFVQRRAGNNYRPKRHILSLIVIMFVIYFVDSLGFLRMLKVTPLMNASWQSPQFGDRLFIALVHVAGAFIAGVLYSALNKRQLFYWILGLFSLTHLQYSLHIRTTGEAEITLMMPLLYALAVSLYTVVNFAVWADLSTPETISINAVLGVGLSAWTATFLSTGLAIYWQGQGMTLERHIQIVDSIAFLAFISLSLQAYFGRKEPIV
jgi:hypothetical protein